MRTPNFSSISYRSIPYFLSGILLLMISSLFMAYNKVSHSPKYSSTPVKSWTWDNKGLQAVFDTHEDYETYNPTAQTTAHEKATAEIQYPSQAQLRNK